SRFSNNDLGTCSSHVGTGMMNETSISFSPACLARELKVFDAAADRSAIRCGKLFRILNPGATTCEIARNVKNKDGSILLVGNSHADSIKSVFADVAASMDVKVYFLVYNNPLMEDSRVSVSDILREAKLHNVNHIVMHYSPKAISAATVDSLARQAGEKDIEVSFIMPVPTWEEHVPKSLFENLEFGRPLQSQTKTNYLNSSNTLRELLSKLELTNFKVYEVYDYFCRNECALLNTEGRPLYFDDWHLTLTGSAQLSELFKVIISNGKHLATTQPNEKGRFQK
ncbi:MAG: hypothetical protein D3906_05105, partial [Candidatus Electrothrix sp. AUS1_2]|nr:hypothetical protein [Candidatus Electrothrix sp. AUS1_2]